ncbi:GNAT family N-acetyltransferase [soil metagenome]
MNVVIFETERFVVREWQLEDIEAAFEIYRNDNVQRFLAHGVGHADRSETLALLERWRARYQVHPGFGFWAMIEQLSGEIAGTVALQPLPGTSEIEVGYHLAESAWGKGYATEIARGAIRYGFEQKGLERIVGVCRPENFASFNVLQKAGLVHQGRQYHYGNDHEFLAITRAEFEALSTDA